MFIERLHIDRFGILHEQEVNGLSPGLCLFLGRNEAGKSTCLRFFQSMLFGYKRGNRSLDPMPEQRGKTLSGGSLFLRARDAGSLTLVRRPGAHGGLLSLSDESGQTLDEGVLQRLLGNLNVDVFDNIFAFSLKNLMDLAALKGDGVRHALHGAAFGLGLRSPAQVLKELEERMSVLLKRDTASSSAAINNVTRELADLREELRARTPDMQLYNELQGRLDGLERTLDGLHAARAPKDGDLRRVRRRLAVWQQWEETRRVREELLGLGGVDGDGADGEKSSCPKAPVFAPDAVQRLDALLARLEERLAAEREAEQACVLLRKDIDALHASSSLAGLHPAVQELRERKARRRDEAEQLPALAQECSGLVLLQEQTLARLGPGWDAERIAAADTSVFSKEAVLRHGGALAEKEAALHRAEQEKSRLAEELADASRQEEAARRALLGYEPPEHPLPEKTAVDSVMAGLARARSALAELPGLRERAAVAGTEAKRALADIDPAWTVAELEGFDSSLNARHYLAGLGEAIAKAAAGHAESRRSLGLAEEAASLAEDKAAAQEQRCAQYGDLPDSLSLEARHGLLRQIERLSIELAAARRDYEAASRAVHEWEASQRPGGGKRLSDMVRNPFFLACALLLLAGLGVIGAIALADATLFLYVGAGLSVLAFISCLFCCIRGTAKRDPDEADEASLRYACSLAESRRRLLAQDLAALAAKASSWLSAASPGEPGEADIERALHLLESQGQKLALLERERQDLFAARQTLASAHERLKRAAGEEKAAAGAVAGALDAWREHLLSMKLSPSMRPEAAVGVFDRAATARARVAVSLEAERAVALALDSVTACLRDAGEIPFFAAFLESGPEKAAASDSGREPQSDPVRDDVVALRRSLAALEKALGAYSRHEEARQKRLGLESVLKERMENRNRAGQRLARAEEVLEAAGADLAAARRDWSDWLAGFGLAGSLSPQSAAEALEAMLAFTIREKELMTKQAARAAMTRGLEDFVRETALLAHSAGLALPAGMRVEPLLPEEQADQPGFHKTEHASRNGSPEKPDTSGEPFAQGARFSAQRPALALVPAALHLLEALSAKVDAAVQARNRLLEKEEQLEARSRELLRARTALELTRENLTALLDGTGSSDAEHFRAAFARFRRKEELLERERSLLAGMRDLAAEEGGSLADLLSSLEQSTLDSLREEDARLSEELSGMEREVRELSVERGQLLERRAALAGGEGGGPLLQREAALREDLRRLARQWSVLALARDFLLTAKARFEEEGQQGVIRFAGDLFAAVTEGEYTGIAASLEGDAFMAVHRSGDRRDPERQLSQGTREQLYLALRLAYIKNHAAKAEPLPIIMDDILVNFDPIRAANTARILTEFARDNQLLFFTCHPAVADLLLEAAGRTESGPPPAAYSISKGDISPWQSSVG